MIVWPLKIALVASDLTTGGAQKVMLILAEIWRAQGHGVSIITIFDRPDEFETPPGVTLVRLNALSEVDQHRAFERVQVRYRQTGESTDIGSTLISDLAVNSCVWRLRSTITMAAAEIVIAFGGTANLMATMACTELPNVHLVVREGNDPDQVSIEHIYNAIRRFVFERAGSIICNTRSGTSAIQQIAPGATVRYLPNPVYHQSVRIKRASYPIILTVGRLTSQKDHSSLLKAFALWSHPEASLRIIGSGQLETRLRCMAEREGITHSVEWHGFVPDPSPYYSDAMMFVLSSRYEGMPMALLEAMNAGLPCIVSDGSKSLLEIVEHEKTGLVVPVGNPMALAAAMQRLANNAALRAALGSNAQQFVQRFSLDAILRYWDTLFYDIYPKNRGIIQNN